MFSFLSNFSNWKYVGIGLIAVLFFFYVAWLKIEISNLKNDMADLRIAYTQQIEDLKKTIVDQNQHITALYSENRQLKDTITLQNVSIQNLESANKGLVEQIKKERLAIEFWKNQHKKNIKLLEELKQIPLDSARGMVVDEKTSDNFIDSFNDLFDRVSKTAN